MNMEEKINKINNLYCMVRDRNDEKTKCFFKINNECYDDEYMDVPTVQFQFGGVHPIEMNYEKLGKMILMVENNLIYIYVMMMDNLDSNYQYVSYLNDEVMISWELDFFKAMNNDDCVVDFFKYKKI